MPGLVSSPSGTKVDIVNRRKFAVPLSAEHLLARPVLAERLASGLDPTTRLTVVRGAPGMGKTTLLADYLRRSPHLTIWYGLDPGDADPVVFGAHLIAGVSAVFPGLSSMPGRLLASLGSTGLPSALGLVCDELHSLARGPLVLVLDDCQHLAGKSGILAGLGTLVRYFPENSQLILAGREIPLLTAGLEIRGTVVELSCADLAFSQKEVGEFLAAVSPGGDANASVLYERSQGWPIAVQFLASRRPEDTAVAIGEPESLFRYVADECFAALPPTLRQQLPVCAMLPHIDAALCQELLGPETPDLADILRPLGMLIGKSGDELRMHPLFQEFLRREVLERWPLDRRQALVGRCAALVDSPWERISLFQSAGLWAEAAEALMEATFELLAEGKAATVQQLLAAFPHDRRSADPYLLFVEGSLHWRNGDISRGIALLRGAEQKGEEKGSERFMCQVWSSLAAAFGAQGDLERQEAYAERALASLPEGSPQAAACLNTRGMLHYYRCHLDEAERDLEEARALFRQLGTPAGESEALHNLGLIQASRGNLTRALGFFNEAADRAEVAGRLPPILTFNSLAICHLMLGQLTDCTAAIEKGMRLVEQVAARRERAYYMWTLGQVQLSARNLRGAQLAFESCLQGARDCGDRRGEMQGRLGLGELRLRQGDPEEARREVSGAVSASGSTLESPGLVEAATLLADIELTAGRLDRAKELLDHVTSCLAQFPNPFHEAHVERLWARWFQGLGDHAAAAQRIGRMQAIAASHGYPIPNHYPVHAHPAQRKQAAAVEVHLLGDPTVRVGTLSVGARDWVSCRAKAALACLLEHPNGCTRDDLLQRLFPEQDASRSAVHTVIARLRQALEPGLKAGGSSHYILFADGKYLFNQGVTLWYDVHEFRYRLQDLRDRALTAVERMSMLEEAVAFYRGPFLGELADIDWVRSEAENLRRLVMEAFDGLFAISGGRDDWLAVERYADQAITLDPLCEAALRAKVVALVMQERVDDASRFGQLASRRIKSGGGVLEDETRDLLRTARQLTVREARAFLPKVDWPDVP